MAKIKTSHSCPKCGGNLYLDRDYNGWYEQCLMCSYMKDLAVVYQKEVKTEKGLKEAVPQKPGINGKPKSARQK
jgi:DNA-directed RNA polymerase subunit M/transcription elongation factor TFIIS